MEGLEAGGKDEFNSRAGASGEYDVDRRWSLADGGGGDAEGDGTETEKEAEGGLHDGKLFGLCGIGGGFLEEFFFGGVGSALAESGVHDGYEEQGGERGEKQPADDGAT